MVQNLCAITSIVLLLAGISMPYLTPNTGWSLTWGSTSFFLSWSIPLYGIAALFSVFACLYSVGYIPFNRSVVLWHFWLSLGCVGWCAIGGVAFYLMMRNDSSPSQLGAAGTALALSLLATIPVFLVAQSLFVFELVRAVIKMRLL